MSKNKLKAIFITACCFVVVLCSEIKCMDTASDVQEATIKNHSENCLNNIKPENKDLAASWVSYVASPVKSAIGWTYNVADFAVKHPTQTMITSLLVAAQFTVIAADCNCLGWTSLYYNCSSEESLRLGVPASYGQFSNDTACQQFIGLFARNGGPRVCYYGCN